MASIVKEIVFDCADAERVARFWGEVLEWEPRPQREFWWMSETGDPATDPLIITFQPVPEPKTVKDRIHIDLVPKGADQAEEVERLIGLGATRIDVGQGDDAGFVVLADVEGNEFCVLGHRVD
jgi:Glyoxalase-like domain